MESSQAPTLMMVLEPPSKMTRKDINTIWAAYVELKAIAARDGAPLGVYEPYFLQLVGEMEKLLGEHAKPWPPYQDKKECFWHDPE